MLYSPDPVMNQAYLDHLEYERNPLLSMLKIMLKDLWVEFNQSLIVAIPLLLLLTVI